MARLGAQTRRRSSSGSWRTPGGDALVRSIQPEFAQRDVALLRVDAPGRLGLPVDLPSHRLQTLACGVPAVTLPAVVQASEAELAAHVLEDCRVGRARPGPSRAASLQSLKSAESKENIEISPRPSDSMKRNLLTLLLCGLPHHSRCSQ